MQDTNTPAKRFQCRHIHTQGNRCGSPCLRGEEFCYFHHTTRKPLPSATVQDRKARQASFDLPLPEDRAAIQLTIGEVLQRIARNEIDSRRAGLLLYGLQIASRNLPRSKPLREREEEDTPESVVEIVQHPTLGTLAPEAEFVEVEEELSLADQLLREFSDPNDVDTAPYVPVRTLRATSAEEIDDTPCASPRQASRTRLREVSQTMTVQASVANGPHAEQPRRDSQPRFRTASRSGGGRHCRAALRS